MVRSSKQAPEEDFEEHIVDTDVSDEMRSSFLEYAYSVIYARALPDAREHPHERPRRVLARRPEDQHDQPHAHDDRDRDIRDPPDRAALGLAHACSVAQR